MCNQQGTVAVAEDARREHEEIARAEQHIDNDDDADADGDEMVPIDPDERDADEDDDDGGGAGGAQQATEKDNGAQVLHEDSETGEPLPFVYKGRTFPLTVDELRKFIAIEYYIGAVAINGTPLVITLMRVLGKRYHVAGLLQFDQSHAIVGVGRRHIRSPG